MTTSHDPPVMTLCVVQIANVTGEEARQVLNEIDFRMYVRLLGITTAGPLLLAIEVVCIVSLLS